MKRLLYSLLGLVVLIVIVVAALPFVISADFVARRVADAVKEETGRDLVLGKDSSFSIYPDIAVELNDVTLTNPPGMAAGNVALTDRLLVKVALMPLLSGKVDIKEFILDAPRLNLLIDGQGHSNWVLDGPAADKPASAAEDQEPLDPADAPANDTSTLPLSELKLAPIEIRNGALRYLDERNGATFVAEDVNLTLSLANPGAPFGARGSLVWNGQKISVDANLRQPAQLASGAASAADITLDSPLLNVGYEGQVSLKDGLSLAGVIAISMPSLREFSQWSGRPLAPGKGLGAFQADSAIGLQGKTLTLKDAKVSLDGMNAQGTVRLELDGVRPKIIATLGVDKIDLNRYLAGTPGGSGSDGNGAAISEGWSREPIDLSGLKAVDADLTLNAGGLIFDRVKADTVAMKVLLDAGLFETQLNSVSLYGGTAAGVVQVDGSKAKPTVQIALSANNFDGYSLLRDFVGLDRIEGQAAASVSVGAVGRSQFDLVSTLRGKVAFKFTDGAVRGVNVAKMVRSVSTGVVDGWQGGDDQLTDFSVFEASFDIENGLAANNDLVMLGPLVRIGGEGSIDLPTQKLDYRVDPKLVATLQGQGADKDKDKDLESFTIPIVVKGPWAKPKIYPDIDGILQDPKGAYKKFKGLVASTGALDLGSGKKAMEDALSGNVEHLIGNEAGKILGDDEAGAALGKQGKEFLDGLLNGKKGTKNEQKEAAPVTRNAAPEIPPAPEPPPADAAPAASEPQAAPDGADGVPNEPGAGEAQGKSDAE